MIGDKILIQKQHKIKAKKLVPIILSMYEKGSKYVVTIAGESGTGKTEIAYILRNLLYKEGLRVQIISLDDYYNTNWEDRNQIRSERGLDTVGSSEIRWDWIESVIQKFKSIQQTNLTRRINKFTRSIEFVTFSNLDVDILLIEGLYTLNIEKADLKILLDGSYKETKTFRIERGKELQSEFRELVLEKEQEEVAKNKKLADVIVSLEGVVQFTGEVEKGGEE